MCAVSGSCRACKDKNAIRTDGLRGLVHGACADYRFAISGHLPAPASGAFRSFRLCLRCRSGATGSTGSVAHQTGRCLFRPNRDHPLHLVAAAGPEPQPAAGRAGLSFRPADSRHRVAGNPLRALLPVEERSHGALLRVLPALHGRDARRGTVRKPAADADVLGADEPVVIPPDRLLEPSGRCSSGRAHGTGGDWWRRAGAARRHPADRLHRRKLRAVDRAGIGRSDPCQCAVPADADPDTAGRVHQVRSVSVPFLVASGHGCADAGIGVPAFGDHGQGRGLPPCPSVSGPGRIGVVVLPGQHDGPGHAVAGCRHGAVPARSQGTAGLFDHQPPGADHPVVRPGLASGRRRSDLPHHQPRDLQGIAVHGRRHHRSRDRHPGHAAYQWHVEVHAAYGCAGHGRVPGHGRCAAAQRLPQQGNVLRRDPRSAPAGQLLLDDSRCGHAGWCVLGRLFAAFRA